MSIKTFILTIKDSTKLDCLYDCTHKFVVNAYSEEQARNLAQNSDKTGDEVRDTHYNKCDFWNDPELTNCVEDTYEVGVIATEHING